MEHMKENERKNRINDGVIKRTQERGHDKVRSGGDKV